MPRMAANDEDHAASVIDALYDAAGDATLWNKALMILADSMSCTTSVLVGHSEANLDAPRFAHFGSLDAEYNLRRSNSECPYLPALGILRPGRIITAEETQPLAHRRASEWHQEIEAAQDVEHLLMTVLDKGRGVFGVFFVGRPARAGDFTGAEREGFCDDRSPPAAGGAALWPARRLWRACPAKPGNARLHGHRHRADRRERRGALRKRRRGDCNRPTAISQTVRKSALGNRRLRKSQARRADRRHHGGRSWRHTGHSPVGRKWPALRRAGLSAARLDQGDRRPGRQAVAVFINRMESDFEELDSSLVEFYRLTPGEARVANILAAGHGIPGTAGSLGLSENTVKMHAKRAFEKLGVTSQVQLSQLYGRLLAPARSHRTRLGGLSPLLPAISRAAPAR